MRHSLRTPLILAAIAASALLGACDAVVTGPPTTVERPATGFTRISVTSGFEVELRQDDAEGITIEAPEGAMEHITTKVSGDELEIDIDDLISTSFSPKKVVVRARSIRGIALSGGTRLSSTSQWTSPSLSMALSGGSSVSMNVTAPTTEIAASGASLAVLRGECDLLTADLSGGSRFEGFDYATDVADIAASGGSAARVWVSERLQVDASGGSRVHYRGRPTVTSNLSGGSLVVDAN